MATFLYHMVAEKQLRIILSLERCKLAIVTIVGDLGGGVCYRLQVMGMIEGFFGVWNFRFRDFFGVRKIWQVFFLVA